MSSSDRCGLGFHSRKRTLASARESEPETQEVGLPGETNLVGWGELGGASRGPSSNLHSAASQLADLEPVLIFCEPVSCQ